MVTSSIINLNDNTEEYKKDTLLILKSLYCLIPSDTTLSSAIFERIRQLEVGEEEVPKRDTWAS